MSKKVKGRGGEGRPLTFSPEATTVSISLSSSIDRLFKTKSQVETGNEMRSEHCGSVGSLACEACLMDQASSQNKGFPEGQARMATEL